MLVISMLILILTLAIGGGGLMWFVFIRSLKGDDRDDFRG